MAGQLKLVRKELTEVEYQWAGAFRMRIEASDPNNTGADPNVFLYRRDPVNPYTGEASDVFFAVASVADLADYPVGEPDPDKPYPFLRLDYIELDFRASSQAKEVWEIVVREVNALLECLGRMANLVEVETQFVGTAPTEGTSDSDSESQ